MNNTYYVYEGISVGDLKAHFDATSAAAFTHILRCMKKAGVVWIQKSPEHSEERVTVSDAYLDKRLFGDDVAGILTKHDVGGRNPFIIYKTNDLTAFGLVIKSFEKKASEGGGN
jgi:hypothetical protein